MADFATLESSLEQSRPIELYKFTLGVVSYRFTSAEDSIVIGSDTYTSLAISRSKIEQGSDQSNRTLNVTMPSSGTLPQQYITVPPGQKCAIEIYRYQRDEPSLATQILLFKGRVATVRFPNNGNSAEFACRSIESAMNRNIPRFSFMGSCNHILYDDNCGVDPSTFDFIGNVSAISGNTITITGLNASGIDYVGGYISTLTGDQDFRMVLAQSVDTITMLLPFANDPTGVNVQCFAGCDHILTGDCALVFDNVANFGGFHYVPLDNIFETGLPRVEGS